jgi:hypothetical protein
VGCAMNVSCVFRDAVLLESLLRGETACNVISDFSSPGLPVSHCQHRIAQGLGSNEGENH